MSPQRLFAEATADPPMSAPFSPSEFFVGSPLKHEDDLLNGSESHDECKFTSVRRQLDLSAAAHDSESAMQSPVPALPA